MKNWIDFYLKTSIHIGFAVLALLQITKLELQTNCQIAINYFVFLGTIIAYNFLKYYSAYSFKTLTIKRNFDVILENITPVSKQIEPILKNLNKEQRIELKNDLLKIVVLSSHQENYSIYDCYSFGLASMVFYEPNNYLEVLEKHKTFSESQRISFAEKIFELEKEGFQNNDISFENFALNSINNLIA